MTDVTDNFNRADQAINASSNWLLSPLMSGSGPNISGNQLVGVGSLRCAYWNPTVSTFANDQFAQATCVTNTGLCGLALRQDAGSNGYLAWAAGGTDTSYIFRIDAGSFTVIGSVPGTVPAVAGRIARFEIAGSTLTLKINGTTVLTATDATYTSGQPGILPYESTTVMDDWSAGPATLTGAQSLLPGLVARDDAFAGTFYAGINYPWNAYAADFGEGGFGHLSDPSLFASDFAAFNSQGIRVARWWIFGDGRYCPVFNPDGTTVGLNSGFIADLDQVLQIAANNNIYLLLTLIDFTMFNTASFSGGVQQGGHDDIIKNTVHRLSFMDNALKPLLQHIAASPHKNIVLGYDIINEPEDQIAGGYNGASFFEGPAQFALADVQAFVQMAASYIHTYSGGGLATLGSAMPIWTPLWIGLGLDFHQAHYYDWMDLSGPGSGLPVVSEITGDLGIHLDAPCMLGEFATKGTGETYGLDDTAVHSARWYLDTILAKGYIGALPWSLRAGDTATDWASFQPVFTNWVQLHPLIIARPGVPMIAAGTPIVPVVPSTRDKREMILRQMLLLLSTVTDSASQFLSIFRNRAEIPIEKLPAVVLLDGKEKLKYPKILPVATRGGALVPAVYDLLPQVFIVLRPRDDINNAGVGEELSGLRMQILKAIIQDDYLRGLLGSNGELNYLGHETDLQTGSTVLGQMQLNFQLSYVFDPNDLN
jgi:hypothetical protein